MANDDEVSRELAPDHENSYGEAAGYRRPPRHSRFKPGQSGNPKGRPRGSKSLVPLVRKALNERIPVRENGRRRTRTKLEVMVAQVVNKSVGADLKAPTAMLLTILAQAEAADAAEMARGGRREQLDETERDIVENLAKRLREGSDGKPR